ncbi:max dimerization protein 1-like [Oscarella lobularis]|uniref:max dimerization protein 1-like n=1 Tax=Oscarella lobularis TaxID=121494 RepID=UPI003313727C
MALLNSIDLLLKAVEVVEDGDKFVPSRRESKQAGGSARSRRESKRSYTYRSTHNQLEKNRRDQQKKLLNDLRCQVPAKGDAKLTTLTLLTTARSYIKELEILDEKNTKIKEALIRANLCLKRRLSDLGGHWTELPAPAPAATATAPSPKKFKAMITKLQTIDSESDVDVEDCSDDNSSIGSDGSTVNSH